MQNESLVLFQGRNMPRIPRLNLPDYPQHVIQRGNNREPCFDSEKDYAIYLAKLSEYADQFKVEIHSYVLMTNHVHLLVTPKLGNGVSLMMQALGRYYVRYFNKRYKRTGTLWEGRFKSSIIDSDLYFLTVSRYIELNPVRAKMVQHPSQYKWSSFDSNAGLKPNKIIKPHAIYLALGDTTKIRTECYAALFESKIPRYIIKEIQVAINATRVLGDEVFQRQLEKETGLTIIPELWGGNRYL